MGRSGTSRAGRPVGTALLIGTLLLAGCGSDDSTRDSSAAAAEVVFTDVTEAAGIHFVHRTGAFGKKFLPETMGSGCAWFDYDGDGAVDLFLVNARDWPGEGIGTESASALYRNRGDGTFEDVTEASGLAAPLYGMGVAVGDFDNDGAPDLFINALGPDRLYRNRGDGTFEDVTERAGISDPAFGASATFLDYDRDGLLDLFVTHYVEWTREDDLFCTLDGTRKSYCTPESYPGASNRLWRNRGDGTFEDVSIAAGVASPEGKSLGVVVYDHDLDGWPDIAVANDTVRNFLYRNNADGTFSEIGRQVGIALSESGEARAGMGIDAGDVDGSGRESIVVGNFSAEMIALFHNQGLDAYSDDAAPAGVGNASLWTLAFGTFFFDYDLDGRLDLFVANGHVEPDVGDVQAHVAYAQPPHLFHNIGGGRFVEVTRSSGADLAQPLVGRGAAYADFDGDGDLDVIVTTNGGRPRLLRNDGGAANGWLRVRLIGTDSNRDALGARLELHDGERKLVRTVRGSSSYLSQSEATVTFGLGRSGRGDRLDVEWPSGRRQTFRDLGVRRSVTLVEGDDLPR